MLVTFEKEYDKIPWAGITTCQLGSLRTLLFYPFNLFFERGQSMQTNYTMARKPIKAKPERLQKRIGSTTYDVVIHFDETKESKSLEEKFLRLINREVSDIA